MTSEAHHVGQGKAVDAKTPPPRPGEEVNYNRDISFDSQNLRICCLVLRRMLFHGRRALVFLPVLRAMQSPISPRIPRAEVRIHDRFSLVGNTQIYLPRQPSIEPCGHSLLQS
jgi:hypothetical protein